MKKTILIIICLIMVLCTLGCSANTGNDMQSEMENYAIELATKHYEDTEFLEEYESGRDLLYFDPPTVTEFEKISDEKYVVRCRIDCAVKTGDTTVVKDVYSAHIFKISDNGEIVLYDSSYGYW